MGILPTFLTTDNIISTTVVGIAPVMDSLSPQDLVVTQIGSQCSSVGMEEPSGLMQRIGMSNTPTFCALMEILGSYITYITCNG
jgi:hypothetical protein